MKSSRLAALAGIAATAVAASFLAPTATPADAAPSAGNPRLEAQQAASAWVKGHGNALERAAADSFVRTGTFEGDNGIYSMAYERTHEGLRVVGGDFVVLANADGQVVGVVGRPGGAGRHRQHHRRGSPRARASAAPRARSTRSADATAPELVIWHRDAGTQLAYEVEVRGTDAGEVSWQKVWVDASDGERPRVARADRARLRHGRLLRPQPALDRDQRLGQQLQHDRPDRDHPEAARTPPTTRRSPAPTTSGATATRPTARPAASTRSTPRSR